MPVEHYVGSIGPSFQATNEMDVVEVVDTLHTQVMDNLGQEHPYLKMLSDFITQLQETIEYEKAEHRADQHPDYGWCFGCGAPCKSDDCGCEEEHDDDSDE